MQRLSNIFYFLLIAAVTIVCRAESDANETKQTSHDLIKKIFSTDNSTPIKGVDLNQSSAVSIVEYDPSSNKIQQNDTICTITNTFSTKEVVSLMIDSANFSKSVIYTDNLLSVLTTKSTIDIYEVKSSSIDKYTSLRLPDADKNILYDIHNKQLVVLVDGKNLLFSELTDASSDSLSFTNSSVSAESQTIYDLCFRDDFLFLAAADQGVLIYNVTNTESPTLFLKLDNVDLNSLKSLNITNVKVQSGILYIYDENRNATTLLNIKNIEKIRRISSKINDKKDLKIIPSSGKNLNFISERNVLEYTDGSDEDSSSVHLELARNTKFNRDIMSAYVGKDYLFTSTEVAGYLTTLKESFPNPNFNYNLATKKNALFKNAVFGAVLNSNDSVLLVIDNKQVITIHEITYNAPQLHCKKPTLNSFVAVVIETLLYECPKAEKGLSGQPCTERYTVIVSQDDNAEFENFEFPTTELFVHDNQDEADYDDNKLTEEDEVSNNNTSHGDQEPIPPPENITDVNDTIDDDNKDKNGTEPAEVDTNKTKSPQEETKDTKNTTENTTTSQNDTKNATRENNTETVEDKDNSTTITPNQSQTTENSTSEDKNVPGVKEKANESESDAIYEEDRQWNLKNVRKAFGDVVVFSVGAALLLLIMLLSSCIIKLLRRRTTSIEFVEEVELADENPQKVEYQINAQEDVLDKTESHKGGSISSEENEDMESNPKHNDSSFL